MPRPSDRRRDPRTPFPHRPAALTSDHELVWVVDLSLGGVRIEHRHPLVPGTRCALQFPRALGCLHRVGEVRWCSTLWRRGTPDDPRFESGIAFQAAA